MAIDTNYKKERKKKTVKQNFKEKKNLIATELFKKSNLKATNTNDNTKECQ